MQLQLREDSSYSTIRAMVVAYEQTTSSWTDKRIYSEVGIALGGVNSYGNPGGAVPMEVDAVQQWKGKGKGDKGKGKGKGKFDFGKVKSKGKGQGKFDSKGKGLGKNQNSNSSVVCLPTTYYLLPTDISACRHYFLSRQVNKACTCLVCNRLRYVPPSSYYSV